MKKILSAKSFIILVVPQAHCWKWPWMLTLCCLHNSLAMTINSFNQVYFPIKLGLPPPTREYAFRFKISRYWNTSVSRTILKTDGPKIQEFVYPLNNKADFPCLSYEKGWRAQCFKRTSASAHLSMEWWEYQGLLKT